tara:strand:+ start:6523 stop:6648 length:126 start_codon:yes stop_codon:yes gene_type:complete
MKNYRYSLFDVLNCPKLQHEVNSKYLVNKLNRKTNKIGTSK